jgi:hypothetical protein
MQWDEDHNLERHKEAAATGAFLVTYKSPIQVGHTVTKLL